MGYGHERGNPFSSDSGRHRSEEKLDMKKLHLGANPTATAKLAHAITPTHEKRDQLQDGSLSLSPERIRAGATTKTGIMNETLERDTRFSSPRHWGINE